MTLDPAPAPGVLASAGFLLDGRWRVRPDLNRIEDGGVERPVADTVMRVLVALAERGGLVTRSELLAAVWPDSIVGDEALSRAVSDLRRLLDDDPRRPRVVETIPKKGYRLVAPVEPLVAGGGAPLDVAPSRPRRRPQRHVWVGLAAVVAVATVAVVGWRLVGPDSVAGGAAPIRLRLTALPGIEEYPTLSPSGDRVAFIWDGDGVEPDGLFVQVVGSGQPLRLTDAPGHYGYPAWSHDSRFIAYARVSGPRPGIFRVPATGGAEVELVAAEGATLLSPAFSPDGRWLVYACRPAGAGPIQLLRMDLATGAIERLAPSAALRHGGFRPRFSPDGRSLAFLRVEGDRRAIVVADADGSEAREVPTGARPVSDFDWAAGGDGLVVSSDDGVHLLGLDGSLRRTVARTGGIGAVSAAARARVLSYSQGRRERGIWSWRRPAAGVAETAPIRLIHSAAWDSCPALAPDGRAMAFLSDRSGTTQLWLAGGDGGGQRQLTSLERVLEVPPSWSPDGREVAITVEAGGVPAVCLVEVPGGRTSLLDPPEEGESRPVFARDGRSLLVARGGPAGTDIWRRPAAADGGREARKITSGGGYRAVEATDGSAIFFTRARRSRELWRCAPDGSHPALVATLPPGEVLTWQVTGRVVDYGYRSQIGDRTYRIASLDLATGETTGPLALNGRLDLHLDVDPSDSKRIVFDQTAVLEADIIVVDRY